MIEICEQSTRGHSSLWFHGQISESDVTGVWNELRAQGKDSPNFLAGCGNDLERLDEKVGMSN